MKFRAFAAVAAGALLATTLNIAPAQAGGDSHHNSRTTVQHVETLIEGLGGPLKVAYGSHGNILVAESFAGMLSSVASDGTKKVLASAPGKEIGAVSYSRGTTYYFENVAGTDENPEAIGPALLKSISHHGKTRTITDMTKWEVKLNPDGKTVYGVRDAPQTCLDQAPWMQSTGEVYSHPYSTAVSRGNVYVGDAGGNALWKVNSHGKASVVKVLPAEPVVIDEAAVAAAAEAGLTVPDCMMGRTYWAQAVPTDIELRGNWLYYTVLPGAPGESMSKGKIYKLNLHSKKSYLVASGLSAPTGIAVDDRGSTYVTELFGGGVSKIVKGKAVNVLPAQMASDVAISGHRMAVSTNALTPSGSIVTATLGHSHHGHR